jgi:hypothetical protein
MDDSQVAKPPNKYDSYSFPKLSTTKTNLDYAAMWKDVNVHVTAPRDAETIKNSYNNSRGGKRGGSKRGGGGGYKRGGRGGGYKRGGGGWKRGRGGGRYR